MCYKELAAKEFMIAMRLNEGRFSTTFCDSILLYLLHQCVKNNLIYLCQKSIEGWSCKCPLTISILVAELGDNCPLNVSDYLELLESWGEEVLLDTYATASSKVVAPIIELCSKLCKYVSEF